MVPFLGSIRANPSSLTCFSPYKRRIFFDKPAISVSRYGSSPFQRHFRACLESGKFHNTLFLALFVCMWVFGCVFFQFGIALNLIEWPLSILGMNAFLHKFWCCFVSSGCERKRTEGIWKISSLQCECVHFFVFNVASNFITWIVGHWIFWV